MNDLNSTFSATLLLRDELSAVEKLMLSQVDNYHVDLQNAVKLLLSTGGKRIRPIIILLISKILGADADRQIILAASIELLHTATLVHDDLIDGALLRRGVPTLNSKWSPAATVLTGDFLFSCAANLAARTESLAVVKLFSQTLITIVNGEINQLFTSKCNIDRNDYYSRIYAKTASLFETSAMAAALISNVNSSIVDKFKKFGYDLGMAFQIVDDVLDYTGSESSIGKPVGGDLRQGLITAPLLLFMENHPEYPGLKRLLDGECIEDEAEISKLLSTIASSNAIELALEEAAKFAFNAKDHLSQIPESPEKDALLEIADFIVSRKL